MLGPSAFGQVLVVWKKRKYKPLAGIFMNHIVCDFTDVIVSQLVMLCGRVGHLHCLLPFWQVRNWDEIYMIHTIFSNYVMKNIPDDFSFLIFSYITELRPRKTVIEVVFHLIILRQAQQVAVLHIHQIIRLQAKTV